METRNEVRFGGEIGPLRGRAVTAALLDLK